MDKKILAVSIAAVFVMTICSAVLLSKARYFSHLLVWNIVDSNRQEDFNWPPSKAPSFFYFDNKDSAKVFYKKVAPLLGNEANDFMTITKIASQLYRDCSVNNGVRLIGSDSPILIAEGLKNGYRAHCFHRSVLFSAYLTAAGFKSRVWALENDRFEGIPHAVNEVYSESLKKWVFFDTMFGFYAALGNEPLSFLELRQNLLSHKKELTLYPLDKNNVATKEAPVLYEQLVKSAFLRSGNDFINKTQDFKIKYGFVAPLHAYLDALPDPLRRGFGYVFGRKEIFLHYVDPYSGPFKQQVLFAKSIFYLFCLSLFLLFVINLVFINKSFQKRNLKKV